jgi:septum formation topological specificity factor MinE
MDNLTKFILDHINKNKFTHNSKNDPKGTFFVDDNEVDVFNNLYINALKDNQPIYINEKMKDYIPILIDFDFKYLKSEQIKDRVYLPILDELIRIIIKIINKYLIVPDDNLLIFLLEKSNPYETENEYKDGIHIVTPFIWIPYELIYIIRIDIIKEIEDIKLFDLIPHTNDINDIYDENPYVQKLWLMFRSYDVLKNKKPYDLTKIYNKNLELQSFKYTNEELIKLFSIRIVKHEYIPKTKISNDDIINKYKILNNFIILQEFLKNYISDENNFNYKNLYTDTYYNITDIPTFYTYLYNSLNDGNVEYLTQKTKEYGPIISDIDIYYEDSTIQKIYPPELITILSDIYIKIVKKYVNVDEKNIQMFVLEKNRAPKIKNLYKDGLHLIMPYICITREDQYFIRDKVINEVAKLDIFNNTQLNRIFDKVVIENTWTIYGCSNQNRCKYKLSKVYDSNLNSIDIEQYSLKDLISILNITKFTSDEINTLNKNEYVIKENFSSLSSYSMNNKVLKIIIIIFSIILLIRIFR